MLFAYLQLFTAAEVLLPRKQAGARVSCISPGAASLDSQAPPDAKPQVGRQNLEDAGIVNSFGEAAEGTRGGGRGPAQMPGPPCAGQMQDGKQEPHQSGRSPSQSGRGPRKCTARR